MQESHYQPFPKENAYRDDFDPTVPDPNDPPWGSWIALAAWAASFLLIVIVPLIILVPYVASKGIYVQGQEAIAKFVSSDPSALLIQVAAVLPAHLLTIAFAYFIVAKGRKHPFLATLGWRSGGMKWWHYAVILLGFFIVSAIVGSLMPEQENDLIRILKSSRLALYTVAFLAVFTAPFVEEVIYRGILYSALQRTTGTVLAVLIVTILFAAVHVPQYWGSPSTILLLTLLSLILTLVRVQTRNLLPCVILHTIFNAIQSSVLLLNPELNTPATAPPDPAFLFHLIK